MPFICGADMLVPPTFFTQPPSGVEYSRYPV